MSFVETYRNCGRKSCIRCRDKKSRHHGPYWNFNYADENGKTRTIYVGSKLPEIVYRLAKVSFADVLHYHEETGRLKASVERYLEERRNLKRQIEELYEQIRILNLPSQKKTAIRAEKFFKQLVLKYHPDRKQHATFTADDVMKDINQLFHLVRF